MSKDKQMRDIGWYTQDSLKEIKKHFLKGSEHLSRNQVLDFITLRATYDDALKRFNIDPEVLEEIDATLREIDQKIADRFWRCLQLGSISKIAQEESGVTSETIKKSIEKAFQKIHKKIVWPLQRL